MRSRCPPPREVPFISTPTDIDSDQAIALAPDAEKVKSFITGKQVVKTIYVPGQLVNVVVK